MWSKIKEVKDTSSLYKNRVLLKENITSFNIEESYDIEIYITKKVICCGKRKFNRIILEVANNGEDSLENGGLKVNVTSNNYNVSNDYEIIRIDKNCSDNVFLDVPFNCCFNYLIKVLIEINGEIIKEKNMFL